MKILIFDPFAEWSPHFETDLELAQLHLDQGDEVHFVICDGDLLSCDINPEHDISKCWRCISRRRRGLKLLSHSTESLPIASVDSKDRSFVRETDKSERYSSDLKQISVGNFDIGYGVLSSLISITRNSDPDLKEYSDMIRRLHMSCLIVFLSMQHHLKRENYDRVYIYNGRFGLMRAALRACEKTGTPFFTHERGSSIYHYSLFENTMPHDIEYLQRSILNAWEAAPDSVDRERIGARFFEDREKGIIKNWFSFIKNQQADLMPPGWDSGNTNISIFLSSEDEFAAIGDFWENPLYSDQNDGIRKIIESLKGDGDIMLYIRVHPNLSGVENKQTSFLYSINEKRVQVIHPDDPVSTYALIKNSDKVVTFGSTVGLEATFWGIPSILAGQSWYRDLGSTYNPSNHEELIMMVHQQLEPKDPKGAIKYGYYFNTFGKKFKYYNPEGLFGGEFKGVRLMPSFLIRGLSLVMRSRPFSWIRNYLSSRSVKSGFSKFQIL